MGEFFSATCRCGFQQSEILHGRGMRVFHFVIGYNDCRKINLQSVNLIQQKFTTVYFDEESFNSELNPQSCSVCGGGHIRVCDNLIKSEHVCPRCH